MEINLIVGLAIGLFLMWLGYFVRTKKAFAIRAGFGETWQPVHMERLGYRIGILFIILVVVAIFMSVFTIWFGETAGRISGVLAIIDGVLIIFVIGLDQIGY